jgi:hypothetical protein
MNPAAILLWLSVGTQAVKLGADVLALIGAKETSARVEHYRRFRDKRVVSEMKRQIALSEEKEK